MDRSVNVLVACNCSWFNVIKNWVSPQVESGMNINLACDHEPIIPIPPQIRTYSPPVQPFTRAALLAVAQTAFGLGPRIFCRGEYKRLHHYYFQGFSKAHSLNTYIQRHNIDLVHCHFMTRPVTVAALFGVSTVPIVTSIHGSDLYLSPEVASVDAWIVRQAFIRSHLIHVPGQQERKQALALGCDDTKIRIRPWFVDTNLFHPPTERVGVLRLRKAWQFGVADPVIISTRKLEWKYDIPTTLKAFRKVLTRHPKATLLLVGDGPDRRALENLVDELGCRTAVKFLGKRDHKSISELLQLADVYVQSPVTDALSYSLLEAVSCGLPIVTTAVGSITDLVNADSPALEVRIVPVGDADSLGNIILEYIANSRKRIGRSDIWFENHYGRSAGMRWLNCIYQEALEIHKINA